MKQLLSRYEPEYSSKKFKPFDTNPQLALSNLANGRAILKLSNSVLMQKVLPHFTAKSSSSLFSNFILHLYIVYELNNWPHNPTNNFTLKNCLFHTVKLVRSTIKREFVYNLQGIAFDGEGSWSFGNNFARNVVIFGVDNNL